MLPNSLLTCACPTAAPRDADTHVQLGIGSTHLLRGYSRTHHGALGPSACEDAGPLRQALAVNRADRRSSPGEIVRVSGRTRTHGTRTVATPVQLRACNTSTGWQNTACRRPAEAIVE